MKKWFAYGGIAASAILIAFGITAIVMGFDGRDTVRGNLRAEQIYFGDAAKDEAVPKKYSGDLVDTGDEARQFALVMQRHTLESTSGLRYAQMGRFLAKDDAPAEFTDGNGGTSVEEWAVIEPKTKTPVSNPARNLWVTETALSTALNTAYFGERVAVFSIIMGFALLLTGIGFLVLTLGGALGMNLLPRRKGKLDASAAT